MRVLYERKKARPCKQTGYTPLSQNRDGPRIHIALGFVYRLLSRGSVRQFKVNIYRWQIPFFFCDISVSNPVI